MATVKPKSRDTMTDQSFGDWVEGQVQEALDRIYRSGPVFYQRLYDTRSAGSYLPAQPGDFIVVANGTPFLVEVKASGKYPSLESAGAMRALIKDHQMLGAHLFARAGGRSLVIFYGRRSRRLEIWDGALVREDYIATRKPLGRQGLLREGILTEEQEDRLAEVVIRTLRSLSIAPN